MGGVSHQVINSASEKDYDLIVIGGGPAGYAAALRAGQTGLKTALIEKGHLGGMCLNWGCIPVKCMLESARLLEQLKEACNFGVEGVDPDQLHLNWRTARDRAARVSARLIGNIETLLERQAVDLIQGEAKLRNPGEVQVENRRLRAAHLLIATGSRPLPLSGSIPGEQVLEIWSLLNLPVLPGSVCIAGEGPNAVEIAQLLRLAGCRVSLVCPAAELLPGLDPRLSGFALDLLRRIQVDVLLETVPGEWENGKLRAGTQQLECERVVNCSLRRAVLPAMDFDLELEDGWIKVDDYLATSQAGIYAAGDVNGRSSLAHAASAQGVQVVNAVQGIRRLVNFKQYPFNLYTIPEIAQVGMTGPELQAEGVEFRETEQPLAMNGKSLAEGHPEGFVRLLSEKRFGQVLGVQIVAPHATDLIAEASVLLELEGTVYDLARVIHAHPTVAEIYSEAGFSSGI